MLFKNGKIDCDFKRKNILFLAILSPSSTYTRSFSIFIFDSPFLNCWFPKDDNSIKVHVSKATKLISFLRTRRHSKRASIMTSDMFQQNVTKILFRALFSY